MIPAYICDRIVDLFKNLNWLAFPLNRESKELLPRLGIECKSVKCLELCMLQCPIFMYDSVIDTLYTLCEHLPNLRHLRMQPIREGQMLSNIFPLLRKCLSLEKITIVYTNRHKRPNFFNALFFKEFIETVITKNQNARIEIKHDGRIIGSVSANGVVLKFPNSKEFIFNYPSENQLKNVEKVFENVNT